MSNGVLPNYLKMAKPNPPESRAPWYKSTAPAYAGIFLWVVFYMNIADGTLSQAGLGLSVLGLVVAALICHFLFYFLLPENLLYLFHTSQLCYLYLKNILMICLHRTPNLKL